MKINSLIIIAVAFMSCNNNSTTRKFDLQGHRGCRGIMPENTIPAMKKAIDLGVNTLEMDVVITADDKVLVSHEPFFNHQITTLPSGDSIAAEDEQKYNIFRMTYDSVRKFDVGLRLHPGFPEQEKIAVCKPLLSTLIDSVEAHVAARKLSSVNYNIEIKSDEGKDSIFHPSPENFVDLVMDVIYSKQIADRVTIQSFDPRSLKIVSQKYPAIKISLLLEKQDIPTGNFKERYGFIPAIVSPEYPMLTKEIVSSLHDKHIEVLPWTVDDLATAKKLYEMGVDGIITDYPDRINLESIKK